MEDIYEVEAVTSVTTDEGGHCRRFVRRHRNLRDRPGWQYVTEGANESVERKWTFYRDSSL